MRDENHQAINKELLSIANELLKEFDIDNGMSDMVISYEPSILSEEIEAMNAKHERMIGGDDLLIVESNRAFNKHPFIIKKP